MTTRLEIDGLDELHDKFTKFPQQFDAALKATLNASLLALDESKPSYPAQSPDSTYVRTGTLGRTLGSSNGGIRSVETGSRTMSAEWGTRLEYAPYVIGEREQAAVHRGRWWTIKTVAEKALPKINRLFQDMTKTLAEWLSTNR